MGSDGDVALLAASLTASFLFILAIRYVLSRLSTSYMTLRAGVRYEVCRRILNSTSQLLLGVAHAKIVLQPAQHDFDILYGYTAYAHRAFIQTLAAYFTDTLLLAAHPSRVWRRTQWLLHHAAAGALLTWLVASRRSSAAPAAVFLVAGAAHVVNDARFIASALGMRGALLHTGLRALLPPAAIFTSVLPPPFLLVSAARTRRVSVFVFALSHMRLQCWLVFLAFYVPHVLIPVYHLRALRRHWMQAPDALGEKDF